MKRRDFLRTAAATIGAPIVAGASSATMPSATLTHTQKLWAAAIANARGSTSPSFLAKALRTSADVGEAAFQHLFDTRVVSASGKAVNPFNFHVMTGGSPTAQVAKEGLGQMRTRLDRILRECENLDPEQHENAFIEPFNGSLRDELLNEEMFNSLDDARGKLSSGAMTTPTPGRTQRSTTKHP